MQHYALNKLQLIRTLPNVFAERAADIVSDVWMQEVTFEMGKVYLVEANSGTGKSSLCSYIYGYRNDYMGDILFNDENIRSFGVGRWTDLRRHNIALLWQQLRLFPELTAMENVEIKNRLTGYQKRKQILEWFERLGIADRKDSLIGRMSFGQQQRVAMIRTLCQPFDFIFIDEPISHLDDENSRIMGEILTDEARRQGAGVVTTSIGKHLSLEYDRVLRL